MVPVSLLSAFAFETVPIATLLVELDGTIVAANPAAARIAEVPIEALVGTTLQQLDPPVGARWTELLARARTHGHVVDESRFDAPSGVKHLQLVIALATADGRELVQVMATDITSAKAAEQAARARADAEEALAGKQRLESLGLVAGGIAHDFNNLLVGVLAEASAAREDATLSHDTREALRRIEGSARRMSQLTRQLLAYAGRGQFVTAPTDADALLQELTEPLARFVEHGPAIELATGAPDNVVEADPALLRQVVENLVANAAHAARTKVSVTTRVVARDGTPWWQLEVGDDGDGIAPATLGRIFEPFFSTKPGHHGLGLSAVHGIVRRLHGDVEVDTSQGKGARFRVRLPILQGASPVRAVAAESTGVSQRLAGLRALVADDEPSVRATVRRLLERRGAQVIAVADGREAEQRLRAEQVDLVVLDVSMPGRTGHEVLVVARATQPGVPVVLMSGYTEKLRGEGSEEEADWFLEKPFTARALDAAIDEVLKGKRR